MICTCFLIIGTFMNIQYAFMHCVQNLIVFRCNNCPSHYHLPGHARHSGRLVHLASGIWHLVRHTWEMMLCTSGAMLQSKHVVLLSLEGDGGEEGKLVLRECGDVLIPLNSAHSLVFFSSSNPISLFF